MAVLDVEAKEEAVVENVVEAVISIFTFFGVKLTVIWLDFRPKIVPADAR